MSTTVIEALRRGLTGEMEADRRVVVPVASQPEGT